MRLVLGIIFVACVACHTVREELPTPDNWKEEDAIKALQTEGIFAGDVLGIDPTDRNAITDRNKLWTNGKIYYVIAPELQNIKGMIQKAMQTWSDVTKGCLTFHEGEGHGNYISIEYKTGCNSYVGMVGKKQRLSLGRGCNNHAVILHELGHALGLYHEQNRSDRDKYVKIHFENVIKGFEYAFYKVKPYQNYLLTDYDFGSIMEYGPKFFSKNGKVTIEVLDKSQKIAPVYTKTRPSDKDIYIISSLYSCQGYTYPPSPPVDDIKCNFEASNCIFQNVAGFTGKFTRKSSGGNGYMGITTGGNSELLSDSLPHFNGNVCVSFKYKINKSLQSSFFVAYASGFYKAVYLGNKPTGRWVEKKLQLTPPGSFRVFFNVKGTTGAFDLDDFSYIDRNCS